MKALSLSICALFLIVNGQLVAQIKTELSPYEYVQLKKMKVGDAWKNLLVQLQRRQDLLPNLISNIKTAKKYDINDINLVKESMVKLNVLIKNNTDITINGILAMNTDEQQLTLLLQKLILVDYKFNDVKSIDLFRELQAQLEGTENRINKYCTDFNDAVREYDLTLLKYPQESIISLSVFDILPYCMYNRFRKKAPKVDFNK